MCRDIYKRKTLKADFLKAAKIINEYKVAPMYDVILDNPFENEENKLETIQALMETPKPFYTQFFSLVFYIGTELFDRAKRECPEECEDSLRKYYLVYKKDILNDMTRVSTFLPKEQMMRLLRLYMQNRDGLKFKITLSIAKVFCFAILEPVTYFRLLLLMNNGDLIKTLWTIPTYLKRGVNRYLDQF